jgi:hypothetical protein
MVERQRGTRRESVFSMIENDENCPGTIAIPRTNLKNLDSRDVNRDETTKVTIVYVL